MFQSHEQCLVQEHQKHPATDVELDQYRSITSGREKFHFTCLTSALTGGGGLLPSIFADIINFKVRCYYRNPIMKIETENK